MNYVLKNAYLPAQEKTCDIAVRDGKFHYLQSADDCDGYKTIDLAGRMVIRGYCDLHVHLDKALVNARVKNRSGTLEEAIRLMASYKGSMTDRDILERAETVLGMCFRNGTRYLRTHVDVDERIGIRSILGLKELQQKYRDQIRLQIVAFPQEGIVESPGNYAALDRAMAAGADLVGGIPAAERDPQAHIDMIFDLAEKYDADIDMHIDETDDPESHTLLQLAQTTIRRGWQGRVTAGHLCSLAANPPEKQRPVLEQVKAAGIRVISLPSTNLYLQGRHDAWNVRRGIASIKRIAEEFRIPTALASDNIRDPFNPFGNGNPLQTALIAAHGCHMGGTDDLRALFDMISRTPLEMLGIDPAFQEGEPADFVVIDAGSPEEAIVSQSPVYGYFQKREFEV